MRYRPKAEQADHNQSLVEAVFPELAEKGAGGVPYAKLRLEGGTFVHVADVEGETNPLSSIEAFAKFQDGIQERCEEGQGPNPQLATLIGSCGLSSS